MIFIININTIGIKITDIDLSHCLPLASLELDSQCPWHAAKALAHNSVWPETNQMRKNSMPIACFKLMLTN